MGYILNVILAYMLFGEAITLQKIIGITIIIIGVYVLAKV
jgi:multidrug transporter EmrE-like cation transporter